MNDRYFTREGKPLTFDEFLAYSGQFKDEDKHVAIYETPFMLISTVYLGINHAYSKDSPPLIFETMVFCGDMDGQDQWRYSTIAEAKAGHEKAVKLYQHRYDLVLKAVFKRIRNSIKEVWNEQKNHKK